MRGHYRHPFKGAIVKLPTKPQVKPESKPPMTLMNQEQFLGIVRLVVPTIVAFAAGTKWIDPGMVGDVTAAVVTLAAVAWTIVAHTKSSQIAAVAAMDATKVSPSGNTITILDPVLARAAKENATPPKVGL
jgi:ABC-type polar amino acid transport system ATPase subunit